MQKKIAHIVVGLPVEGPFDYAIPENLQGQVVPGQRALVIFAGRKRVGFVVSLGAKAHVPRLNPVLQVLDKEPVFNDASLAFARDFALHFGCSLGEALELFLPAHLRSPRPLETLAKAASTGIISRRKEIVFDQGLVKRWDVIVPKISEVLAQGRGVLCLVPDSFYLDDVIPRLTPLVRPDELVVLRQGTEKEEFERWMKVRSGEARLALGFISAVFAPMRNLGLIVIFDEESSFYKHDQSPFYHARDAAFLRSQHEGCQVLCVSSAPSVELWRDIADKKADLIRLTEPLPPVKLLDLQNFKMKKETSLSQALAQHMEGALKEGGKVLLYVPAARGTSDVVREAAARFPGARVAGYEKASTALPDAYDILVSTQVVFRHRMSLRFQLSAVLDIDWEFHKTDHRAAHGAFILVQRLRQMTTGIVLLQTRQVNNEYLHYFTADDYDGFYRRELRQRKDLGLPPFSFWAALVVRSADPELACAEAKRLYDIVNEKRPKGIDVLEPQPDRTMIVRNKFRYCLMAHGKNIKTLMATVKGALKAFRRKRDVVVTVNVNP